MVSPFAGESDICPFDNNTGIDTMTVFGSNVQTSTENLCRLGRGFYPYEPDQLHDLCKRGYDDTLRFLKKNCEHCNQTIR